MRSAVFLGLATALLLAAAPLPLGCAPADGDDDSSADTDTDSDTDSDTDTDTDSDSDTNPANDSDGDGFTFNEGDCDDNNEFVNPMAIEDLGEDGTGDEVDNDCDGETDEVEAECDCVDSGNSEQLLAYAMHLCDDRFVESVEKIHTSSGGDVAFAALYNQGNNDCLVPTHGCQMAAISSGPVGQPNPNQAQDMGGGFAEESLDPQPDYMGDLPTTTTIYASCDVTQIALTLNVPTNAVGLIFDFLFASAEYDEWVNMGYNDPFYAIVEDADLNGGATTNIAFDDNNNEIEVDTNFFENVLYPCDESGSGWSPDTPSVSGSTGWLRTSWPVTPGSTIALTFSIHDEGDCIYDSIAFIDAITWSTEPVDPGTDPILE
jgi:hypothetical protein